MNLGQRLNRALATLLLEQQASAIDYSRDHISMGEGGHGAHGIVSGAPSGSSRPLVLQWSERFEKLIESCEADARALTVPGGRREFLSSREIADRLRKRIGDYEGRDEVYVAYHEGCSVPLVRKVRREAGLRMTDGTRLERGERPLTAPPREALKSITSEEAP